MAHQQKKLENMGRGPTHDHANDLRDRRSIPTPLSSKAICQLAMNRAIGSTYLDRNSIYIYFQNKTNESDGADSIPNLNSQSHALQL